MTRIQLQGLCLWAGLLALVLLAVFPLTASWRVACALVVVATVVLAWRFLQRRPGHGLNDVTLPPASYRHPVVLVCGDGVAGLFGVQADGQPGLRLAEQGCYIAVPATTQLSTFADQIIAARPGWRAQLCVMSVLNPCQHTDMAVLAGQQRRLDHQLAMIRRRGLRLPLMVVSYLHTLQAEGVWFSWAAGQASLRVWEAGACSGLADWQRQAAGPAQQAARLQVGVRLQSLAQWFADKVVTEQVPGGRAACFAFLAGQVQGPGVAENLWQRWLQARVAVQPVIDAPAPTDTAPALFPDALLHLLVKGRPQPAGLRACKLGLWLFVCAGVIALLSSAWQNTLLARQVSDDLRRYAAIAPGPHTALQQQQALAALRQDAQRLDHYYRQGEPWSLGLGLYQGERIRLPLLATLASHRQAPPPEQPTGSPLRLDSLSLFSSGSAQLKPESTKVLVNALMGIKAQPGWLIVIAGHTDATGSEAHNIRLSRARAGAVHDWIRRMSDIPDSCFAVQGFGASQPVASNDSELGRSANRRVEIRLVPEPGACAPPSRVSGHPLPQSAAFHTQEKELHMAIPVYLWLQDDGGADLKGSVNVSGREGTIEVVAQDHSLYIPTDNNTGKLTGTRIHTPFLFSKEIDASSPYLYKAVTTGQTLKTAEFKWYRIDDAGQEVEYFNTKLENVKVVKVAPKMHDIKDPAKEKHNHLEEVELRYEKITWTYKDGNIIHSDAWNERPNA